MKIRKESAATAAAILFAGAIVAYAVVDSNQNGLHPENATTPFVLDQKHSILDVDIRNCARVENGECVRVGNHDDGLCFAAISPENVHQNLVDQNIRLDLHWNSTSQVLADLNNGAGGYIVHYTILNTDERGRETSVFSDAVLVFIKELPYNAPLALDFLPSLKPGLYTFILDVRLAKDSPTAWTVSTPLLIADYATININPKFCDLVMHSSRR